VVDVDLVHDVHDLVLGRVAAERAHQHAQFLGADEAVSVLKERERERPREISVSTLAAGNRKKERKKERTIR
jgi:hypothetical protein